MLQKIRSNSSALVLAVAFLILSVSLAQALILFARHASAAITFPYPLEYAEGPVLDQTLRLVDGENIYRTSLSTPPYTITNEPPLYMLLQVPFARAFGPAYWYGRVISLYSLVLAALFLGLTLYELTRDVPAAVVAGLLLFTVPYFFNWSVLNRVDTLAFALSWIGLFIVVRLPDRLWGVLLAALFFTAVAFTQPTYCFAAPAAALAWFIQARRFGQSAVLLAGTAGLILVLFLAANAVTRGGFYFNLITASTTSWFFQDVFGALLAIFIHGFLFVLFALFFFLLERMDTPTQSWPFVLAYFVSAFVISAAVGKQIASDRFLFEFAAACCLTAGAAMAWIRNHWVKTAFLILLVFQINSLVSWTKSDFLPIFADKIANQSEISKLASLIQNTDGPVLVDEYNGLIPLAGRRLYYQPVEYVTFIYIGLAEISPLEKDISHHRIRLVMVYFPRDASVFLSRWPPNIYSFITANYTVTDTLASTLIFSPK